jgi:hypothetical protein
MAQRLKDCGLEQLVVREANGRPRKVHVFKEIRVSKPDIFVISESELIPCAEQYRLGCKYIKIVDRMLI